MNTRDDKLMEEAYDKVNEGMFRRSDAKAGTRMKAIGAGVLNYAGNKAGGKFGDLLGKAGNTLKGDVDGQRLSQLVAMYITDIEKLMAKLEDDVVKMGMDKSALDANPDLKASNPKAGQIGNIYGGLKNALNAARSIRGDVKAPMQSFKLNQKPAPAPVDNTNTPQGNPGTIAGTVTRA